MSTPSISVTQPVGQAIERVKQVLFRSFDLSRWFIIGFCAWLAYLGQGGGGFNFRLPGGGHRGGDFPREFEHARDFVMENLYWIVPLAVMGLVFCIGLWVVFTWLSSRGQFMFLHCVALNKAEVTAPWNRFIREGNSLFRFRLVLGLISMAVMLPMLILGGLWVYRMFVDGGWNVGAVLTLIGLGLVIILVGIAFAIVNKLTIDFVVPVMFLRGKTCLESWAELRPLLTAHLGLFVLYFLFQIVLCLAIVLIVLVVVLITCCLAGCLLILPYLGTVLLLPVLVFKRAYSLHYLAQYGGEYDAFPRPAPPPLAGPAPAAQ
jgi:hypothetical protein